MANEEFKGAVELTAARAPRDWTELRIRYRYYDGAMDVDTSYKSASASEWKHFDVGSFDLMDWFEAYYKSLPPTSKPWSAVTLTVDRKQRIEAEYGYGDPGVLDR